MPAALRKDHHEHHHPEPHGHVNAGGAPRWSVRSGSLVLAGILASLRSLPYNQIGSAGGDKTVAILTGTAHRLTSARTTSGPPATHQLLYSSRWAAGHAPAALLVPLGRRPRAQLPRGRLALTICQSGNRSADTAAPLLAGGVGACNVRGGMRAWQAAGLPVTTVGRPDRTPP